jgi:hypothetical protein
MEVALHHATVIERHETFEPVAIGQLLQELDIRAALDEGVVLFVSRVTGRFDDRAEAVRGVTEDRRRISTVGSIAVTTISEVPGSLAKDVSMSMT